MARSGKFLIGAILGALFGVAFAPKKGSELRKDFQDELKKGGMGEKTAQKAATEMGKDIAGTAQEVYQDPQVQKQLAKGKKEAQKLVDQAREKIQESSEEWVKMAREKIVEGKKQLEQEGVKAFDTLKKKVIHPAAPAKPAAKKTSAPAPVKKAKK
jgi:gas vesicle protein